MFDIFWVLLLPALEERILIGSSLGYERERTSLLDGCGVDGA